MAERTSTPDLPPVVDAGWVAAHHDEVVLADVRSYLDGRSGRAAYDTGHLPGAVFVELDTVLAAPVGPGTGRHPLPDPVALAEGLGALGIADGDTVVAYDDTGGGTAARLVWMLRATGQRAALLDGGLTAWPGPLETAPAARPAVRRTPAAIPGDRLATAGELGDGCAHLDGVLLDARVAPRYRGETEPVDPVAGHVPGARNLPWPSLLDPDGRFLPADTLRERFAGVGVGDGTGVVAMCGSGVSACVDLLALERAGLGPGRLYVGSWSHWCADPDRPVATGEAP